MISACPHDLAKELNDLIYLLAQAWRDSDIRPRVAPKVQTAWDDLIDEWVASPDLPLLVRKSVPEAGRGWVVPHQTGRELVPADNTPANWSLALALNGKCPSLADIRARVESGAIPVAMVFKREERAGARFTGTRAGFADLNKLGWKVCHRRAIGIGQQGSISELPLATLTGHFRDFLSPSNMFFVPKVMAGLGELPHVLAAMQGYS